MLIQKKAKNSRKILLAVLAAVVAPWLAVALLKGFQLGYAFVKGLPAWQQTATWVSFVSVIAIIVGFFLFKILRAWAIARMHVANDKPRKVGVRFFGGGFVDVLSRIHTDRELRYKAQGFAFTPRSIKGDAAISICEDPFPVVAFPVREAIQSWSGAVAQRHAEEPDASSAYSKWASEHREIVALLDIVGKGSGFTGLSCLHTWKWLGKPDVFRFLVVVFDPEEAKTEENADDDFPDIEDIETEKEVETCVS